MTVGITLVVGFMELENITVIILLLAVVTALAEVTDRIKIPYPVLLVLAGIGISLIPQLPVVELNPDVVFLIFLPPALYAAAWTTSWTDFKARGDRFHYWRLDVCYLLLLLLPWLRIT